MKDSKSNDKSSLAGKKATLICPKSTSRHNDPKIKSIAGKAMNGGKLKK